MASKSPSVVSELTRRQQQQQAHQRKDYSPFLVRPFSGYILKPGNVWIITMAKSNHGKDSLDLIALPKNTLPSSSNLEKI
jgi:hypothetical protein